MRHSYQFRYQRVFLRPLEQRDIEELRVLRNKNRFCFNTTNYISAEQQRLWFQNYLRRETDVMFSVETVGNPGVFTGAIALYNIDLPAGRAEFGRTVLDKERVPEKGIGTEAVIAVCRIAFEQLGISEVTAEVLKSNPRALKAYEKAGCRTTGENDESWYLAITPDTIGRPQ